MRIQLWRIVALLVAVTTIVFAVSDAILVGGTQGFAADFAHRGDYSRYRVLRVSPRHTFAPDDLVPGDVVRLRDDTLAERIRYRASRAGDRFVFERENKPPVTVTLVPEPNTATTYAFAAISAIFALAGGVLAGRRPRLPEVRALATILIGFGSLIAIGGQTWMPDPLIFAMAFFPGAVQFIALGAAVELATIFPVPSNRGFRAVVRRVNPFVTAAFLALTFWVLWSVFVREQMVPQPFATLGQFLWVYYLVAITGSFFVANRVAGPADRNRVRWVSWSLAAGFCGPVATIIAYVIFHVRAPWVTYLQFTLVAIPFGLGYAILRHRVVDIGFVVNRAIVFGTISAIVLLSFAVLEWLLSAAVLRVSHVTSTSLELGLALGLGFSLRWIHGRVDRVVDDLFFRARHEAERALRVFAREVSFITEPQAAVARTHAALRSRTETSACAIYVLDGAQAVRVDAGDEPLTPFAGIDDPALVRMRATREPVALGTLDTAFHGDRAFPMLVRDAVTGTIVLGPKTSGEAYAPDEIATVEQVALALGNALDALQTAALKAEIARVLVEGASLDDLRRTVTGAAWIQGGLAQPAGLTGGRGERL